MSASVNAYEAAPELPPLYLDGQVNAPLEEVWAAWTTADGLRSFFAREAVVDPIVDGEFSILFFPDAPAGQRGAEGNRVVAIEPQKRLLITWNCPPWLKDIVGQRALVEYRFLETGAGTTKVQVKHFGWGSGADWENARRYFEGAWVVVLARLEYRFRNGPIEWDSVPKHLLYSGPR